MKTVWFDCCLAVSCCRSRPLCCSAVGAVGSCPPGSCCRQSEGCGRRPAGRGRCSAGWGISTTALPAQENRVPPHTGQMLVHYICSVLPMHSTAEIFSGKFGLVDLIAGWGGEGAPVVVVRPRRGPPHQPGYLQARTACHNLNHHPTHIDVVPQRGVGVCLPHRPHPLQQRTQSGVVLDRQLEEESRHCETVRRVGGSTHVAPGQSCQALGTECNQGSIKICFAPVFFM